MLFDQLLLDLSWHSLVVRHLEHEAALAAGHALELGRKFGNRRKWHRSSDLGQAAANRFGALNARTLRRQQPGDVAHDRIGHGDFKLDDRFENLWPGLFDCFQQRLAPGDGEGDFLGIDGVILAVVDHHFKILQRKAGDRAFVERLAHAFLDCRDQAGRDHAADHFASEYKALATPQRPDPQKHFAELAGAAGLLLVPTMAFGRAGDRFAVGNSGWTGFDIQSIALLKALQQNAKVHFAEPADHGFIEFLVVFDPEAGVFLGGLVQGGGQFLFLAAGFGLDRQPEHWLREVDRLEVIVILVVVFVQDHVVADLVDLGQCTDVARQADIDLRMLGAVDSEQVRDLDRFARIAHQQLHTGTNRALENAEDRKLAGIGVVDDLEHMRQNVSVRIRSGRDLALFAASPEVRRVAFQRAGQQPLDEAQQLAAAGPGACRSEADRHQMAFTQCQLERIVQFFARNLLAIEIPGHQRLVDLDHLVANRGMGFGQ